MGLIPCDEAEHIHTNSLLNLEVWGSAIKGRFLPPTSLFWPEIFVSILKIIRFIIDALTKNEFRVDGDQRHQAKFNPSGGLIQLGIFSDNPNTIGLMTLAKYSGEVGDDKFDYIMAGGVSFVLTRGKLLYVLVYSLYENQNDIDWVKSKSREFIDTLLY